MGRQKSNLYVSDKYVEEMEHYINNNISPTVHPYYTETDLSFNAEKIKQVLKPGEEYVQLEYELKDCVVTSFGRSVNSMGKQYAVKFTPNTLHLYVRKTKVDFVECFKSQGWEWDIDKFKSYYIKYGWRFF